MSDNQYVLAIDQGTTSTRAIIFDTKGSIVSAEGMLYIYTERRGNVALVKPNAEKFEMISSFRITEGNGPHWAHPTINDGKLYIRHGKVMLVYDVKNP